MSRTEYMRELDALLQGISKEEREEAMQYYNDYFDDAGSENEEKVIEELGSPAKLAETIRAGINGNTDEAESYGEYGERGYQDRRFDTSEYPAGKDGYYKAVPVEYKRGKPKTEDSDILQVAAQALCLEEMLCCRIPYGYIYYGETRHRMKVEFTDEIQEKVKKTFAEMHRYYEQRYTPKVKTSKKCNACSLKDICLPVLNKKKSVSGYIDRIIAEEEKG